MPIHFSPAPLGLLLGLLFLFPGTGSAQLGQDDPHPGLFSLSERLPEPPPPDETPVVLPPLPTASRKTGPAPTFRPGDPTEVVEVAGIRLEVTSRRDPDHRDFFWIRVRVLAGARTSLSRVVFHELPQTETLERLRGERLERHDREDFVEGLFRGTTRIRPVHVQETLTVVVTYQWDGYQLSMGPRRTCVLQVMIPPPAPLDVPEGRT